ncbi:MAG: hypothetical protein HOV79_19360, partial [Hamadaea sp.]|nr:hypothetical protein [Hamadaea sp.]
RLTQPRPPQPPVLVRQIRAARRPISDADDLEPADAPTAAPGIGPGDAGQIAALEQEASGTAPAVVGTDRQQPLPLTGLPRRGVGLTGGGSAGAARGLIVAVVTSGDHRRADGAGQILTTDGLLTQLGVTDPQIGPVTVADSVGAALHRMQLAIHDRYRRHGDDVTGLTDSHDLPPRLVLLPPVGSEDAIRLAALAARGHLLGVHAVLLGPWSQGATWAVGTDGRITDAEVPGTRLNSVDATGLSGVLDLVREIATPATATGPTTAGTPSATRRRSARPPAALAGDPATAALRLDVLGTVRLAGDGGDPIRIGRQRSKQIAVLLALHRGGLDRGELLEFVYGDMRRTEATKSLQTGIWELNRSLVTPAGSALIKNGEVCKLDPQLIEVDWWDLQAHVERGEFQQAIELYRGPLAGDAEWDWLPEQRHHVRQTVAAAYAQWAASLETAQERLDAVKAGLDIDPWSEELHQLVMSAHATLGDPDRVTAQLETLRERLAAIGLAPSEQTVQLVARLTDQAVRALG